MTKTPRGPILITGGAGFIGCALAKQLLAQGETEIWAADSLLPQVHRERRIPDRLPPEVRFVPFDVSHEASWEALLATVRPVVVVHLAAETGTGQSLTEASRHAVVNVVGTTRMLDAFSTSGWVPEHFVLASSRAVYGEGQWRSGELVACPGIRRHEDLAGGRWLPQGLKDPVPEPSRAGTTPANPTSVYGATKLAQEHVLRAWCGASGASLSLLRLQNVYGPGQSLTNAYTGIVSLFARQARGGDTIDVYEDGHIIRDFVFIDDVVDAISRSLACRPAFERLLDIGSGSATTILQLGRMLAEIFDAPQPLVSGRFRDGDVRAAWADISAAKDEIGYVPTFDLPEGIRRLLDWMEEQS